MKKLLLLTAVAIASVATSFAQEKAFAESKLKDKWFIQGQLGGSYTFSEGYKDASFGDLITPHLAISVGKYFVPSAGARFQVGGWKSKSFLGKDLGGTYNFNYLQANADGLLNLTNLFMSYKEDRVFNFIGIVGIGFVHGFKKGIVGTTNSIVPRAGFQGDFRLNQDLSINLEVVGNLMPDNFNGNVSGDKYDATVNALVGLTYKFGENFKPVDIANPAELKSLNDKINEQRALIANKDAEINKLTKDLANKPAPEKIITKEIREETDILMNAVVVFRLGSAQLEKNQDINIFNAARYLKDNPKVNIVVTGYADKSTGTKEVNQKLSEKRAEAVASILRDKYDISADRITTKASGDSEQLFPTDEWNRVVVFTAKGM